MDYDDLYGQRRDRPSRLFLKFSSDGDLSIQLVKFCDRVHWTNPDGGPGGRGGGLADD